MRRRMIAAAFAIVPFGWLAALGEQGQKVHYATDIAPIFKAHCISCHAGADAAAGLDLTNAGFLGKRSASGLVVTAGLPDKSLLLERVLGHGGKAQMPMGFPALSADSVAKLRTWIAEGARVEADKTAEHWAYVAPVKPKTPVVKDKAWVRNPIDAFVLARLENEGLHPSEEASKETLIRRVSLDLTGLPPEPKEIDAFVADKRLDAYEKLVDRLLASPHYGERQAQGWLDLARYADTDGYEKDLKRTAWKYRDWVIDAFNKDVPYDKFTIEQIAGDLLPSPNVDQLVATGFNRNSMFNREGGVDQAEAHFNVVLDRVNTTATVWLGSTLQCARCHDHKYDPFTQRDYYRMAAFYSNAVILPQGPADVSEEKWFESEIAVPSPAQVAEETKLQLEIQSLKGLSTTETSAFQAAFEAWRTAARSEPAWSVITPRSIATESHSQTKLLGDGAITVGATQADNDTYTVTGSGKWAGETALRLEALTDPGLARGGPGRADNGNFVLSKVSVKVNGQPVPLVAATADFEQSMFPAKDALGGTPNGGWAVEGGQGKSHQLVLRFAKPLSGDGRMEVRLEQRSEYPHHSLGKFRLSATDSAAPESELLPDPLRQALTVATPTEAQLKDLKTYFETVSPELSESRQELMACNKRLAALRAEIPTALIMRDKPTKAELTAYIHSRGEFLSNTELVTAGTPAHLPAMDSRLPRNRLGLAEWLVSAKNPLTARVEVNRIWEQYFGRGIVETSEDFGTQGSRPTHQALLDWLAYDFVKNRWDMKAIHRLIVTSATYRQSSNATEALVEKDPQNLLLARGPRFRLSAETLRDQALKVAGMLNLQIGGPSVYPFQPAGIWDSPYSGQTWAPSSGGQEYRRGLYTFWKRTAPYPSFTTFDSTSREECTVRRIRTNTPLQALAMLNDPAIFVAAKALGQRMIHAGGTSAEARLAFGFRICTGRTPTGNETARLGRLLSTLKARYSKDAKAAKSVAGTPTDAAYTMTANVLLNLDETLTKE